MTVAVGALALAGLVSFSRSAAPVAEEACRPVQPATFAAGRWPDGCWRPYAATSPFNRRIGPKPVLARGSARVVRRVTGFGRPANLEAGTADTPQDFGHPVYWSTPRDPFFRLRCVDREFGPCPLNGHRIRIPDRARPAGGRDAHLTVVDQRRGWEYDLYRVYTKPRGGGVLHFRYGGRTRIDGSGLGSDATAARFGGLAGIIRAAELEAGRIEHALFMVVLCDSGRHVFPARKSGRSCADAGLPSRGAPPMGARFQLAMKPEEIDALDAARWQKTILHAMAEYGMYVGDTGGSGWGVQLESGSSYTSFGFEDPMVAFARDNGWVEYRDLLVGKLAGVVDWRRRLRVVAPCVAQRRCPAGMRRERPASARS